VRNIYRQALASPHPVRSRVDAGRPLLFKHSR
jgi:hypothetical protein